MSDDKTIVEKSMTQTDAVIEQAKELAAMCDTLIAEKENLVTHNAMLRDCLSKRDTTLERAIKYFDAADSFNYTGKDVSFRLRELFKNSTPK